MVAESDPAVAVVGMSGRFPGAADVDELWRGLRAGSVAIREFSREEIRAAGVPEELADRPEYVPFGADLAGAEDFDADFFAVPRHEAPLIDPQHRIFLECAWQALADAGHAPGRFPGRIGVFGSASASTYLLRVVLPAGHLPADGVSYPVLLGNDKDFLCTRVSHRLGLTGPSITVQTACSASLVAVHLAVQSLLAGECEMALAGGVSITVPQHAGYTYRDGGILSRDGRCRVFDAGGSGTVKGNGCGVVVLRRLADAVADGDHVYAVVRGTAVNNDGFDKVGFTAPSVSGQIEVIRDALAVAGVPAADIGYVEAHGTGTWLGDPIELQALARAHRADGRPPAVCHVGSVKANLGHLDAAAGVTGLIKAVLVLRDQTVPVQADFRTPNPQLAPYLGRYRIPTATLRPADPILAAAVSSFGLGGTNAHAVLVPAPAVSRRPATGKYLIALSARDREALRALAGTLRDRLAARPDVRLDDVAFTLAAGRARYAERTGFRVASVPELVGRLDGYLSGEPLDRRSDAGDGQLRAWRGGGDLAPDDVGEIGNARRTPLPSHPLRRIRCWLDGPSAPASTPTAAPATPAAPATADADLTGTVRRLLARLLDVPALGVDDDLYDGGMDSLLAVEVVAEVAAETGLPLRFEQFNGVRTVRDLVALLATMTPGTAAGPGPSRIRPPAEVAVRDRHRHLIAKIRGGAEDRNVFLVHPAGGTTVCYADLSRHSRDDRTVWGLAFPVAEAAGFPTLRDLARLYLGLVRDVQPTGPYLLGGYSFGGNVAVEMALALEATGEKVDRVVLIDSHPPEAYVGGRADQADFVAAFPALVAAILPGTFHPPPRPPRLLAEAIAAVRQPSWSAATVREIASFFHVWVHNHQALKRWYPDAGLKADLVLLAATEPEEPTILDRLGIRQTGKETWARHVEGAFQVMPVEGDHYSVMRDEARLRTLAAAYDEALRDV